MSHFEYLVYFLSFRYIFFLVQCLGFFYNFFLLEDIQNLTEHVPEQPYLLWAGGRRWWRPEVPDNLHDSVGLHHLDQTSWTELLSITEQMSVGWIKKPGF